MSCYYNLDNYSRMQEVNQEFKPHVIAGGKWAPFLILVFVLLTCYVLFYQDYFGHEQSHALSSKHESIQVQKLKAEVERLMFARDMIPVTLTKDIGRFGAVMHAFATYEETVVSNNTLYLYMPVAIWVEWWWPSKDQTVCSASTNQAFWRGSLAFWEMKSSHLGNKLIIRKGAWASCCQRWLQVCPPK